MFKKRGGYIKGQASQEFRSDDLMRIVVLNFRKRGVLNHFDQPYTSQILSVAYAWAESQTLFLSSGYI